MKNLSVQKIAFLQALGILIYTFLFGSFMWYTGQLFDKALGRGGSISNINTLGVFGRQYPLYFSLCSKSLTLN